MLIKFFDNDFLNFMDGWPMNGKKKKMLHDI